MESNHNVNDFHRVNNFAKALSMHIKPGKNYLQRLVDNSKKFVIVCRKIDQRKRRTLKGKSE